MGHHLATFHQHLNQNAVSQSLHYGRLRLQCLSLDHDSTVLQLGAFHELLFASLACLFPDTKCRLAFLQSLKRIPCQVLGLCLSASSFYLCSALKSQPPRIIRLYFLSLHLTEMAVYNLCSHFTSAYEIGHLKEKSTCLFLFSEASLYSTIVCFPMYNSSVS